MKYLKECRESVKLFINHPDDKIDWHCKCDHGYARGTFDSIYECRVCDGHGRIKASREYVIKRILKMYPKACIKNEEFYTDFCPCPDCLPACLEVLKKEYEVEKALEKPQEDCDNCANKDKLCDQCDPGMGNSLFEPQLFPCLKAKECLIYSEKCPFPHGIDCEECPEFDYIYFEPKEVRKKRICICNIFIDSDIYLIIRALKKYRMTFSETTISYHDLGHIIEHFEYLRKQTEGEEPHE